MLVADLNPYLRASSACESGCDCFSSFTTAICRVIPVLETAGKAAASIPVTPGEGASGLRRFELWLFDGDRPHRTFVVRVVVGF